jgi:type II secretory pathway component GspD/PulD (secretin)/Mg-chelatase subunit ChlD
MLNPELPPNNRAELEARVTAMLLGELSAEDATALRQTISQDAALAKLHERLRLTLDLVRETAATSAGGISEQTAPLKLSPARREALLAHFKIVSPKQLARPRARRVSLIVQLAATAAILLIVAGICLLKLSNRGETARMAMAVERKGIGTAYRLRAGDERDQLTERLRITPPTAPTPSPAGRATLQRSLSDTTVIANDLTRRSAVARTSGNNSTISIDANRASIPAPNPNPNLNLNPSKPAPASLPRTPIYTGRTEESAEAGTANQGVVLNLHGTTVDQVLDFLGEKQGLKVIRQNDTYIPGTVDLVSDAPLNKEDTLALANKVLASHGLTAIEDSKAKTLTIERIEEAEVSADTHVNVATASFDIPPEDTTQMRLFFLTNADSTALANELKMAFPAPSTPASQNANAAGRRGTAQFAGGASPSVILDGGLLKEVPVNAVADPRTQSVLVTASKDTMEQIEQIVDRWDEAPSVQAPASVNKFADDDRDVSLPLTGRAAQNESASTSTIGSAGGRGAAGGVQRGAGGAGGASGNSLYAAQGQVGPATFTIDPITGGIRFFTVPNRTTNAPGNLAALDTPPVAAVYDRRQINTPPGILASNNFVDVQRVGGVLGLDGGNNLNGAAPQGEWTDNSTSADIDMLVAGPKSSGDAIYSAKLHSAGNQEGAGNVILNDSADSFVSEGAGAATLRGFYDDNPDAKKVVAGPGGGGNNSRLDGVSPYRGEVADSGRRETNGIGNTPGTIQGAASFQPINADALDLVGSLTDLFPQANGRASSTSSQQNALLQRQTAAAPQQSMDSQSTFSSAGNIGVNSGTLGGRIDYANSGTMTATNGVHVGRAYAGPVSFAPAASRGDGSITGGNGRRSSGGAGGGVGGLGERLDYGIPLNQGGRGGGFGGADVAAAPAQPVYYNPTPNSLSGGVGFAATGGSPPVPTVASPDPAVLARLQAQRAEKDASERFALPYGYTRTFDDVQKSGAASLGTLASGGVANFDTIGNMDFTMPGQPGTPSAQEIKRTNGNITVGAIDAARYAPTNGVVGNSYFRFLNDDGSTKVPVVHAAGTALQGVPDSEKAGALDIMAGNAVKIRTPTNSPYAEDVAKQAQYANDARNREQDTKAELEQVDSPWLLTDEGLKSQAMTVLKSRVDSMGTADSLQRPTGGENRLASADKAGAGKAFVDWALDNGDVVASWPVNGTTAPSAGKGVAYDVVGGFNGLYWTNSAQVAQGVKNGGALPSAATANNWSMVAQVITPSNGVYSDLTRKRDSALEKKAPQLGDTPIIGGLFKREVAAAPVAAPPANYASGNNSTTRVETQGNSRIDAGSLTNGAIGAQAGSVPTYTVNANSAGSPNLKAALAPGSKPAMINFDFSMPADQVLNEVYGPLVGRTPFRANVGTEAVPKDTLITLKTQSNLTKSEAIIALETVMGMNGIAVVPTGEKFFKVVSEATPPTEGGMWISNTAANLPDAGKFITEVVPLKHANPDEVLGALSLLPRASQQSVTYIPSAKSLILRDYTENVKRMLEMLEKLDVESPPTIKSKVSKAPSTPAVPPPVPQPEVQTHDNAFSTFSLNVSDVSFKLAAASLQNGLLPEPATVRSEEFINAFNYRDSEPTPGAPIGFASERAGYPFAHNRDLLRFSVKTAAEGRQAGRPLNLVLLLDKSGSMERADRVAIIREALRVLATQLQAQDTISVVVFSRTARLWADGIPGNLAAARLAELEGLTPEGGTNLEEAMRLAYETALRHYLANGENRVVLLTDGAANLGDVEPDGLRKKVEANRAQGITLDCFGVGWEDYNDNLLEVLSRSGGGRYGFVNTPEEAATGFAGQLAGALRVAASDVKVQVEFNPARVISWRQIGYAKDQLTKEQFRDNTVKAAQISVAESGNALYTVELNPAGDGPICAVYVRYRAPGTADYFEHAWSVPYTGVAAPLDKASPAMRLAATATGFSEWLAGSPYAGEVTLTQLQGYLRGVPEFYGADARPKLLETMLSEARSISGR